MTRQFPKHDTHEAAAKAGCFYCSAPLDGKHVDTGYPGQGCGKYSQRCTGKCGMNTYYDITVADRYYGGWSGA